MDLQLAGKRALITGGSRGIGLATAQALAAEGVRLCLVARGEADLAQAQAALRARGAECHTRPVDLGSEAGCKEAVEAALAALGGLDLLVNNAGGSFGAKGFDLATAEQWKNVLDVNLMAAVWCSQHAVAWMKGHGGGAIVHVGSVCGREYCTSAPYVAAKAALHGLTKEMGTDLAKHAIRVSCVAPGSVMFPGGSWDKRQKADPARIQKMIDEELPFHRFGTPAEIASVVTFLLSPQASWISGSTVVVDGAQGRAF